MGLVAIAFGDEGGRASLSEKEHVARAFKFVTTGSQFFFKHREGSRQHGSGCVEPIVTPCVSGGDTLLRGVDFGLEACQAGKGNATLPVRSVATAIEAPTGQITVDSSA